MEHRSGRCRNRIEPTFAQGPSNRFTLRSEQTPHAEKGLRTAQHQGHIGRSEPAFGNSRIRLENVPPDLRLAAEIRGLPPRPLGSTAQHYPLSQTIQPQNAPNNRAPLQAVEIRG